MEDICDLFFGKCNSVMKDCDDEFVCMVDMCEIVVGCVNESIDCGDGVYCLQDFCDVKTGCYTSIIENCFLDGLLCFNGDVSYCNDENVCINDVCVNGVCINAFIVCSDGDICIVDVCEKTSGCSF